MTPYPPDNIIRLLRDGQVIPAHPLALTSARKLDERRQRALTRYYLAAGAGGVAVGVHTTQFEIREPKIDLYRPVLALAAETVDAEAGRPVIKIAGVVGKTRQAVREAEIASSLGYHLALVSLGALRQATNAVLIDHLRAIAAVIPIMGFYLQPAAGGRLLDYTFWRQAAEIENVLAIKIAPFNRYQTLDVLRGVADAGRAGDIALYTGNDDQIVLDLLTPFHFGGNGETLRIRGGLLGQWAVWTHRAVDMLARIKQETAAAVAAKWLTLAQQLTDANGAIFDPQHQFSGCIPGIHEILRRQGLLANRLTLNPAEKLSPGQMAEIDRVCAAYPHLTDDDFVRAHLDDWLR